MRIIRSMWFVMVELIFAAAGYKIMNSHPEYVKLINWPNAFILTFIFLLTFKLITDTLLVLTDKARMLINDKIKSFLIFETISYYGRVIGNLLFINMMFFILVIGRNYLLQYNVVWMILFMQIGATICNLLFAYASSIDFNILPNFIDNIVDDFNDNVHKIEKQFHEDMMNENENDS